MRLQPEKENTKKIKISKNGPYVVEGGIPLSDQIIQVDKDGFCLGWKEGRQYATGKTYSLCRCGHSKNKPFCDGTHGRTGFDGTETSSREKFLDQSEVTEGPGLNLTDVPELCAEARFCHRATGLWELLDRSDDPVAKRICIEEACNCPSGRLVLWEKNGQLIEPHFEPSIGIVVDPKAPEGEGPLWVRGGILIEAADGTAYEIRNRVTLCRCGKSEIKPFCDGHHID
jgi:CDGSH-type Zn-finger protein